MIFPLVLAVLLSIPCGLLLALLARDELISGRKYFLVLSYVCAFGTLAYFMFYGVDGDNIAFGFSTIFVGIMSYISYRKSFDNKWIKGKGNV